MIVGKSNSDPNNENFDVLKFACRDVEDVVNPSYIKRISSICFEDCKNIETIEFNDDSKIELIEPNAFYMSSLESFYIPPKLKELKDGWCSGTANLVNVSISSENKYFKLIDKKMIVGKLNVNSNDENFDVLKFVCRDVEEIKIPSYIKYISPYCFEKCQKLKALTFSPN